MTIITFYPELEFETHSIFKLISSGIAIYKALFLIYFHLIHEIEMFPNKFQISAECNLSIGNLIFSQSFLKFLRKKKKKSLFIFNILFRNMK